MQKHWDVAVGFVGTATTLTLTQFNQILACAAGMLTLFILAIRATREWRNRNKPPEDKL